MHLSISSVTLDDFKSFSGGPHTLDFDAYPLGLCYLKGYNDSDTRLGSNGSGKSSLWGALMWCLYGKTHDDLKNPDVRSWFGGKTAKVTVVLNIDDEQWEIARQANPNRLRLNGKDVGQGEIDTLIGLSFETFLNTILLGQGRPLFFDLEPRAKLQLFSEVLALQRWEYRSKIASDRVADLNSQFERLDRIRIRLEAQIESVESQISEGKRVRATWDTLQREKIADLHERLIPAEAQLQAMRLKLAESETTEDMATAEHQLAVADNEKLFKALFAKRDELVVLDTEKGVLQAQCKQLRKELEELRDPEDESVCPTCGQSIEGTDLDDHIKSVEKKLKVKASKIKKLDESPLYSEYEDLEEKTNALKEALDADKAKLRKLRTDVEYWRERCGDTDVKVRNLTNNLYSLEEELNPYSKQVREGSKKLKELKTELRGILKNIKDVETKARRTKYWVKGFKDIRLLVMEDVLQELEIVTTTMLQEVGLVDWHVKYDIEKETASGTKTGLNLEIFNPVYGKPVKWKSWSGGEAQRLRIIGSLALAQVLLNHAGITTDMEILDEPITFMGEEGVEDVCQMLHYRSRNLERQIWYTDHHTVENRLFDSVVTVVKDANRQSRISDELT